MKDYIRLKEVSIGDRRIDYRFESSLKFFDRDRFGVWYDHDFERPSASMAAVPFAAVMASFMWMNGADLEMEVLDEGFADSIRQAEGYFHGWFSKRWDFKGQLKTAVEKNTTKGTGEGVLYSGGLDALTTYLRHKDAKPQLFSFIGADVPQDQPKLVDACRKSFKEFAEHERVKHWLVESDFWKLLDHSKQRPWTNNWWGEACHAMILASITAPVSYRELNKIWIASSHVVDEVDYGWGSDYYLDNMLHWAGASLKEDNEHAGRFDKMRYFKDYPQYYRFLRVCYTWWNWSGSEINCGRCEKCYRSILELLLNKIEPSACNFSLKGDIFGDVRKAFEKSHVYYTFFNGGSAGLVFWQEIQDAAKKDLGLDRNGSHAFLKWFTGYERLKTIHTELWGRLVYWARVARWNVMKRLKG